MSLLMRTPEDISALKSGIADAWARSIPELKVKYAERRGPTDPATLEEYLAQRDLNERDRQAMSLAPHLMNHRKLGQLLNNMR